MKSLISTWALSFIVTLTLVAYSLPILSLRHPGYCYDYNSCPYSSPNWMYNLDDDTKLSELSIPGTHASLSLGYGSELIYRTQTMPFLKQLDSGIRFFDLGCYTTDTSDKTLYIYSGRTYLHSTLEHIISLVVKFLKTNTSETVILYLHLENCDHPDERFIHVLMDNFNPYLENIWDSDNGTNRNPTLGEIRGKIVFFHRLSYLEYGINCPDYCDEQADNYLWTIWDLYDKWLKVKKHANRASAAKYHEEKIFVNWLIGYGGAHPFFVASGHLFKSDSSPQLTTGFTYPFSDRYPDFIRDVHTGAMSTISFTGINMLFTDYANLGLGLNNVGVVVSDFPGPGLIDSIISANRYYVKPGFVSGQVFRILSVLNEVSVIDYDMGASKAVLWKYHHGKNQHWKFDRMVGYNAYVIRSVHDTESALTVGDTGIDLCVKKYQSSEEQIWLIEHYQGLQVMIRPYLYPQSVVVLDKYSTEDGNALKIFPKIPKSTRRHLFLLSAAIPIL